jgi:hypothetical protein
MKSSPSLKISRKKRRRAGIKFEIGLKIKENINTPLD